MPCIICFTAIIFNIILILFSVYIFCQTKIAATHCAAASCGLRPLLCALFCNKLTLAEITPSPSPSIPLLSSASSQATGHSPDTNHLFLPLSLHCPACHTERPSLLNQPLRPQSSALSIAQIPLPLPARSPSCSIRIPSVPLSSQASSNTLLPPAPAPAYVDLLPSVH